MLIDFVPILIMLSVIVQIANALSVNMPNGTLVLAQSFALTLLGIMTQSIMTLSIFVMVYVIMLCVFNAEIL
jgi:hypothetical protein